MIESALLVNGINQAKLQSGLKQIYLGSSLDRLIRINLSKTSTTIQNCPERIAPTGNECTSLGYVRLDSTPSCPSRARDLGYSRPALC